MDAKNCTITLTKFPIEREREGRKEEMERGNGGREREGEDEVAFLQIIWVTKLLT